MTPTVVPDRLTGAAETSSQPSCPFAFMSSLTGPMGDTVVVRARSAFHTNEQLCSHFVTASVGAACATELPTTMANTSEATVRWRVIMARLEHVQWVNGRRRA